MKGLQRLLEIAESLGCKAEAAELSAIQKGLRRSPPPPLSMKSIILTIVACPEKLHERLIRFCMTLCAQKI